MQQVRIRVIGRVDERWSEWLDGLTITHTGENETVLTGLIRDQSALYGLISKLRDLGLPLSAVKVGEEVSMSENDVPCQNGSSLFSAPLSGALRHSQRR